MSIALEAYGEKYMDRNSPDSSGYKLESQIREAYGQVVYTLTCHNKMSRSSNIKTVQIVLSALTMCGFLSTVIYSSQILAIVGAVVSLILLSLNTYVKSFNLTEIAESHRKAADGLWIVREEYKSLLADFDVLDDISIREKRDALLEQTSEIYSCSPRTNSKSYKKAQNALKKEEEQTFSENEIDDLLPNSLRRTNQKQ